VVLGTPQGYRGDGVVKRFWEIVEHHHINFFSGVPTLYASLLDIPVDGHVIDSLEYGLCGAAPMPVGVFRAFQEKTGIRILEGYG
ncbi:AMP-binding protein, partial [Burkholderia sp. SIMBA_042]